MNIFKKIILTIVVSTFFSLTLNAQDRLSKEQVRVSVQLKMVQATRLQMMGNVEKAKSLVNESIAIMLTAIRNGESQPWMKSGLTLAMQSNRTPPEEIERIMAEVDRYISTVEQRPLTLREKLNSLEDTPATRELARDRRALMFNRTPTLGQRGVGYHPIISIIPKGTMMRTGSVIVSPDRRYVRVGISTYQMDIGAVHTFNFSTGASQTIERK
tara:strand:+ start:83 stop:724 length:642 start_codon:yes stop_codon:yes gene_type:complete